MKDLAKSLSIFKHINFKSEAITEFVGKTINDEILCRFINSTESFIDIIVISEDMEERNYERISGHCFYLSE